MASADDKDEILSLYRQMLYGPAGWDEHYPSEETIDYDLSRDALFVMKNENGEVVATVSIDLDDAVEQLSCWDKSMGSAGELSRLCVRADMRNLGIARQMMQHAFDVLRDRGYQAVHILVKKGHENALRSYSVFGYKTVGECFLHNTEYFCLERPL